MLVILIVQIVAAKYSRTKFLNKLTLIPFYFCIFFLMLLMFQVALISYCSRFVEQTWYSILYDNVPMAKAIMFCISVLVQLLEWNCLIFMMRFQADKKSKNRVQITIDQYQTRERFWSVVYFVWIFLVAIGLFVTSFVTEIKHHEDKI